MFLALIVALCALVAPSGASAVQSPAPKAAAQATKTDVLERVAIIGASVSEGFQAAPGWQAAFEASLVRERACVANAATALVFMGPKTYAAPQLERVLAERPTLVLAVDFLFWFGYGTLDFEGGALATGEARLALFERGLALLDKLECTLAVGDLPDMSAAVGRMLEARQVPQPATLDKLNARLAAWAKPKHNVVVVPLAAWMRELQAKKPVRIGAAAYAPTETARWMQTDALHPTAEGLAALATLVGAELEARKLVTKKERVAGVAEVLERMKVAPTAETGAPAGK